MGARDKLRALRKRKPKRPLTLDERIAVAVDKACRGVGIRGTKVLVKRFSERWHETVFEISVCGPIRLDGELVVPSHGPACVWHERWAKDHQSRSISGVQIEFYQERCREKLSEAIDKDFLGRFAQYRVKGYLLECETALAARSVLIGWDVRGTNIVRETGPLTADHLNAIEAKFKAEYEVWEHDDKIAETLMSFLGSD
jgi:hypothetical protein